VHEAYYEKFLGASTPAKLHRAFSRISTPDNEDEYKQQLRKARQMIRDIIKGNDCGPILIRLAWHDSGTYDKANEGGWPRAGGAIGSIRYDKEINAGPNAGLRKALAYLQPVKDACSELSWADIIQMGSAEAVQAMGGPTIRMKYGRLDAASSPETSVAPFGLPDALPPFGGPSNCKDDPAAHLRYVFYKYGFDDQGIVALSGAHTVGRAFKDRSGAVEYGYSNPTTYTKTGCPWAGKSQTNGGQSWTKSWLKFDNSYFNLEGEKDKCCVVFPTDAILAKDPGFKPHFEKYAKDQNAFFTDYAKAHKQLSELGSKFAFNIHAADL
jgi:L-ascorbate peroxidase